jgi:hypothetical protein
LLTNPLDMDEVLEEVYALVSVFFFNTSHLWQNMLKQMPYFDGGWHNFGKYLEIYSQGNQTFHDLERRLCIMRWKKRPIYDRNKKQLLIRISCGALKRKNWRDLEREASFRGRWWDSDV